MIRAGLRNGYMLLLFIIFAVFLNEFIILGNDLIAQTADKVLGGEQMQITGFLVPLLWMTVLGTAAAYLKSISGNHYSAMVQRDVRASLGRHLVRLPFSYFDEKSSGSIITRLISDMDELGRFFSEILPNFLVNIIVVVNATFEEVVEACRNANIHDFILQLPEGYETLVGERGVRLSGGQRQRISIARAFLKDAPILLLDEPTAAVDVESEQKIQEAIERITVGRTVIVIAHRLSTVRNAKRIYVVSGGKIAETGNHEELMERRGIYAEIYAKG